MAEPKEFWDFLYSARDAKAALRKQQTRVAELTALCTRITPTWSTEGGGGGDAQRQWAQLADARSELRQMQLDLGRSKYELGRFLERMDNPHLRGVLVQRYVNCLRWEKVAAAMSMSVRHVFRVHGRALQAAQDQWAKELEHEG